MIRQQPCGKLHTHDTRHAGPQHICSRPLGHEGSHQDADNDLAWDNEFSEASDTSVRVVCFTGPPHCGGCGREAEAKEYCRTIDDPNEYTLARWSEVGPLHAVCLECQRQPWAEEIAKAWKGRELVGSVHAVDTETLRRISRHRAASGVVQYEKETGEIAKHSVRCMCDECDRARGARARELRESACKVCHHAREDHQSGGRCDVVYCLCLGFDVPMVVR